MFAEGFEFFARENQVLWILRPQKLAPTKRLTLCTDVKLSKGLKKFYEGFEGREWSDFLGATVFTGLKEKNDFLRARTLQLNGMPAYRDVTAKFQDELAFAVLIKC